MRESVDHESDLSWVFFAGGLSQKDMDTLVEGLSDEKTRELQEKLKPHIDMSVSSELPVRKRVPLSESILKKMPKNGLPNTKKPYQNLC